MIVTSKIEVDISKWFSHSLLYTFKEVESFRIELKYRNFNQFSIFFHCLFPAFKKTQCCSVDTLNIETLKYSNHFVHPGHYYSP